MASWNGNQPANFTATNAIIFSGEPTQFKTWVKHSRSLSAFAGMSLNIAFRHHNVTDMFWLVIDDIKITSGNTASIDEVNANDVKVYPNPSTGRFMVRAEQMESVTVYDAIGHEVLKTNNYTVDLSSYSDGVYLFQVVTSKGVYNQKVVKK